MLIRRLALGRAMCVSAGQGCVFDRGGLSFSFHLHWPEPQPPALQVYDVAGIAMLAVVVCSLVCF